MSGYVGWFIKGRLMFTTEQMSTKRWKVESLNFWKLLHELWRFLNGVQEIVKNKCKSKCFCRALLLKTKCSTRVNTRKTIVSKANVFLSIGKSSDSLTRKMSLGNKARFLFSKGKFELKSLHSWILDLCIGMLTVQR